MPKFLRYLATRFVYGMGAVAPFQPAEGDATIPVADVAYLCWMYQEYALPMQVDGVSKMNIFFTIDAEDSPASIDPLGIGSVWERFSLDEYGRLNVTDRPRFYLDRLHRAMVRCADQFGWKADQFHQAYQRILDENLQFNFFWKRPIASPDRKLKAQAFVDVSGGDCIFLCFLSARKQELNRVLFSRAGESEGSTEAVLGDISWAGPETVKITMSNGRDFWLCHLGGQVDFHYPRADSGDSHGVYDLGRMYYGGTYVLQDKPRGLMLIREAAERGFKHAVRFLGQIETAATAE